MIFAKYIKVTGKSVALFSLAVLFGCGEPEISVRTALDEINKLDQENLLGVVRVSDLSPVSKGEATAKIHSETINADLLVRFSHKSDSGWKVDTFTLLVDVPNLPDRTGELPPADLFLMIKERTRALEMQRAQVELEKKLKERQEEENRLKEEHRRKEKARLAAAREAELQRRQTEIRRQIGRYTCVSVWSRGRHGYCGTVEDAEEERVKIKIRSVECGFGGVCRASAACSGGMDVDALYPKGDPGYLGIGDAIWVERHCLVSSLSR